MRENLTAILIAALVLILVFGLYFGIYVVTETAKCNQVREMTGMETVWKVWAGCFVEHDEGAWIPYDRWLYLQEGAE